MRKPTYPESLYLDFDGFFAACEEQADPRLAGRPVGVVPFADAVNSCVIAANAWAKSFGVKTGISIAAARRLCPDVARQVKRRLRDAVGPRITCSIGCDPNRWLAKITADLDKPDGLTVLRLVDLPGRLLDLDLEDLPGIGRRMSKRLVRLGYVSIADLWQADPIRLRAAWTAWPCSGPG